MLALAMLLAVAGATPHPAAVRAQATASVRIVRPVIISASTESISANWRETNVHLPDGTIERVRVLDLP